MYREYPNEKTVFLSVILILISILFAFADEVADFDTVYKKLAEKLVRVENKLPNKIIAVYGFAVIGRPGDSYSRYATEKLTHEIVNEGSLIVIERSRIDEILREQSLSVSDIVDAGTAARIGKILAVDAVVIGTILVTDERTEFIVSTIESERGIILSSVAEYAAVNTGEAAVQNPKAEPLIIKTLKTVFSSDESISIGFSGLPGNNEDWITLVQASASDETYGDWFYTYGEKSGSYTFKKVKPGDYEIRLYFDWPAGGYVVQKRISITVK